MKTEKNLVGFYRVFAAVAALTVALGGGLESMAAVLPAGYTPVEYIESSGALTLNGALKFVISPQCTIGYLR